MRHTLVLLSLAVAAVLIAAGCTVTPGENGTGADVATGEGQGHQAEEPPATEKPQDREEQMIQAVRRFLGPPDARIEIEKIERDSRPANGWESEWSFAAFEQETETPSQSGTVYFDDEMGAVSGITVSTRLRAAGRVEANGDPPAEVRETAQRIVAEFTPFEVSGLTQQSARLTGGRVWTFTWEEPAAEQGVWTGGRVGVGIAAVTGEPVSFRAYLPRKIHSLADIAVTHDQARQTAATVAAENYEVEAEGRLYLSSPMASGGPVWQFGLLREGRQADAVVIDAMTGEHIRLDLPPGQ